MDMKKILLSIVAVAVALVSCSKHEIMYDMTPVSDDDAEFQLHYMEPVVASATNYMDSVFINGTLYSSIDGSGSLATYNGVPGGGVGRFFRAPAGSMNIKLWRKGAIVYDKDVTVTKGKQNVIIYDLNQTPVVIDNQFPYWSKTAPATVANWGTDSVCKVMFLNFLYESPGVPYPGKLQYQGIRQGEDEWFNVGEPVGFGEATDRVEIILHKTVYNSSGYQRIDYRILDEDGNELQKWNGSRMVKYSDYWTGYIGRVYMHFFRGYRTTSPVCNVSQWTSL